MISSLLTVDPTKRLSAKQALRNPEAGGLDLNKLITRLPYAERLELMRALQADRKELLMALREALGVPDVKAGVNADPNVAEGTHHLQATWGSARMRRKNSIVL